MTGIPLQSETSAMRALSVVVTGMMVALGILVLAGAAAVRHLDVEWRHALADRWTVELDASDPTHPVDLDHVLATLRATPGVIDAQPVAADEMRRLLRPWLRDDALAADLPLPILFDLKVDPNAHLSASAVAGQISAAIPSAKLDDHGPWTADLLRLAQAGEVLGLVLFAAIALTALSTIAATARARLAANAQEIELLHTLGATDGYIARQFQAAPFRSAIIGALAGTIVAAAAIWVLTNANLFITPLIPRLRLTPVDWTVLAAVPVGAVFLAMLVARTTAYMLARRLP